MPYRVNPDSFGFLITDVYRLIRAEMDRAIADAGIGVTPSEARTLVHAARAGSVRQNVLAERLGIEAMTLSGYIDRLELRGLVTREPDPTDRRAKLVTLTEKADAVLEAAGEVASKVRRKAAGSLDEEQWENLLDTMTIVRGNLSQASSSASVEATDA